MRVLIVSQYYYPEPVPKIAILATNLVRRGHAVTVLTGFPCYPHGRIYEAYQGRTFLTEFINGVEVIRVPQLPDHSTNPFLRVIYYLSFPLFGGLRLATLVGRDFDVAYFYSSAVPILILTPLVKLLLRISCVFDVADLWPESVESSGMLKSPRLLKILSKICGLLYRCGDHIGAVTQGYKDRLVGHGISDERITVTYYCVAEAEKIVETSVSPPEGAFTVAFTGMMGPSQGLDVLLDAAKIPMLRGDRIRFVLAGSGVEEQRLIERARTEAICNVKFLGRLPAEEMPALYRKCSALFVHLKPDILSGVSIPSKTYSYMAAGKPIVMAVDGEAARFIRDQDCGITATAGDPVAVAEAIWTLSKMPELDLQRLGSNGRRIFEKRFSVESHVTVWETLLSRYCRAKAPVGGR